MPDALKVHIKDGKIFCPLVAKKNQWLVHKPEEEVRQRVICRVINNYGYPSRSASSPNWNAARADARACREAAAKAFHSALFAP